MCARLQRPLSKMIMLQFLSVVAPAATVFASTNLDDLVVVSAFFAERRYHCRTIVASQFLGIGILVLLSAFLAVVALRLPSRLFPCLGLVPLGLGLVRLRQRRYAARRNLMAPDSNPEFGTNRSGLLVATMVTIATGSDNLSVYVPFFAKAPEEIPLYAATFALLAGAWCWLGYSLVSHDLIGSHVRRLGPVVMPVVMILVGLWVLGDVLR